MNRSLSKRSMDEIAKQYTGGQMPNCKKYGDFFITQMGGQMPSESMGHFSYDRRLD